MRRYEQTLEDFLDKRFDTSIKLERSDLLEIIIQLIDIFKVLHACKRTYNDLKLANIMIDDAGV